MKILNIILTIIPLLLISCDLYKLDNEVKKGLIQEENKLVITSFISPEDTSIMVLVGKSFPIFDKIDPDLSFEMIHVNDAEVIISNGTLSKKLNEIFIDTVEYSLPEFYCYCIPTSEFPIVAGESYTITATTPDGLRATAHCTVPLMKAKVSDYELKSSIDEWGRENIDLIVSWQDFAQTENFYRIAVDAYYTITSPLDSVIHRKRRVYDFGYYSDHNRENEILKEKGSASIRLEEIDSLTIKLFSTDYHYYQYHTSIENYQSGDPFAEPSRIYSNVENGYGVFAGYQKSVITVGF